MNDAGGRIFRSGNTEPADAAARRRIVTELDRSLLVEAGAGSGKTHEMAARMAAGVAAGVYDIEHMAAVTFTRKAAAELRGRFQLALENELALGGRTFRSGNSGNAGDTAARLRSALSNLERFFAGTIHAFCARLLRERPVEAGVSPGFTELDDAEEMMVRRQSWRDYRAQAKAAGESDLIALLDAGIEPKHLDKAFDVMCQYEDVEFPPGDAAAPDGDAAWKALEEFWKQIERRLPNPIDPKSKCATIDRAERFAREWRFASRNRRDAAGLAGLLELWQSKPDVTLKWWPTPPIAREAKALHEAFRTDVVLPHLVAWRQYVYRLTVTLLDRARKTAKAERLRRNSLSFNDLLLITADVLRNNASVRHSLQQKYRWLFVDEFQDTDPVQAEIMFLLAEPAEARIDDSREGGRASRTLFVVGDPKQSIFRFRRADIDIYNEVRTRLGGPKGDGIVRLTTNFRSVPGLCDWANTVFQNRFPAAPTQHAPMFSPLDAARSSPGASAPGTHLATLTIPPTVDSDNVAAHEAALIARYIRSEVDAGRRTFGSFLILTRKKKGLQAYARALEELQVPIEVTGAGAFGESDEVRHLALLIGALADPQDAVALVGVLRGPLFGISDPDLFAFRQTGGHFSLFAGLAEAPEGAKADVSDGGRTFRSGAFVRSALVSLRRWHRWTRMLPAGAALDRILEDSGMLALAATSPGGVEAGDLLHAIDRVRAVVEGGFTLADAADALASWSGLDDDGVKESTEVDSLPLQPGRQDVVRLMNLHKAKGLEADVVFLADPLGGFKPRADVRVVRSSGAAAHGYFRIEKEGKEGRPGKVLAEPAGWAQHEQDEMAYLNAESDRLLYVAATRARDLLVIGRYAGGSGKKTSAWGEFDSHLAGVPELQVPAVVTLPAPESVDLSSHALAAAVRTTEEAQHRARRASWAAVSVTAESKNLNVGRPFRAGEGPGVDAAADDPTRVLAADTPSRRADAGIAWGTLVHGLLEHAMRHKSASRDDLRRLALWLTMEEPDVRVVIEQALDTVQSVAAAEFWQTARASAECHEEAPFAVRENREGVTTVMNGVIDLAYRDADRWRILDYKTDADVDAAELQKRYAAQVEAYRRAWGRFTAAAVTADIRPARETW